MKTNWKVRCRELEKELADLRGDQRRREDHHEREVTRLKNEALMWRMQAVALGKAMHVMLPEFTHG